MAKKADDNDQLTESQKEYLTTLYHLSRKNEGEEEESLVRIKDIAAEMGVAPPSVVEYVQRLARQEKVRVVPRKGVSLTEKGLKEAKVLVNRHRIIACFLKHVLKLDEELSNLQAHAMEHLMEGETMVALFNHINAEVGCPHKDCTFENICDPSE